MVLNKGLKDPAQSSITGKICNGMGTKKTAYGKALHTLFSAELKPRGYYLIQVFGNWRVTLLQCSCHTIPIERQVAP